MFVRVVDSGSFSAVAREAGIGQPAVSKQIAALEARLGAQLLRRTSRSLSVTEAGQDFYESAVRLVDDLVVANSKPATHMFGKLLSPESSRRRSVFWSTGSAPAWACPSHDGWTVSGEAKSRHMAWRRVRHRVPQYTNRSRSACRA